MSEEINEEKELVDAVETVEKTEEEIAEEENRDPVLARGDSPDFHWFIATAMTGQENKVQKTLRERIINYNLTEYFAEIVVPEQEEESFANGKKRILKKKLYPGYIILKMMMNEKTWHLVKNTDKITGFVGGTSDKPLPISDDEAMAMTSRNRGSTGKVRSNISFSEGDEVKVIEGPFASFVGTIEAVSEKGKIKVNVSIFGRPTPVELDFTQVEKV